MIIAFVSGQSLKLSRPKIVAGSNDYLDLQIVRQTGDWAGLSIWAHFTQDGKNIYDIEVHGDRIEKSQHLNLSAGSWQVYFTGLDPDSTLKITTEVQTLTVQATGCVCGPFPDVPPSHAEQITRDAAEAKRLAQSVRDDADAGEFDGGYYKISATADGQELILSYTGSEPGMEEIPPQRVLIEIPGVSPEEVAKAVAAYLEQHPVQAPVQSVNSKTGAVMLTAADVQAVGTDQLPAAINEALAQAKASGAFDGKDGKDGQDGAPGRDGKDGADGAPGADGKPGQDYTESPEFQQLAAQVRQDAQAADGSARDAALSAMGAANSARTAQSQAERAEAAADRAEQGGSGGPGAASVLIVHSADGVTADKTAVEIDTAAQKNMEVILELRGKYRYNLYYHDDKTGIFINIAEDKGSGVTYISQYEVSADGQIKKTVDNVPMRASTLPAEVPAGLPPDTPKTAQGVLNALAAKGGGAGVYLTKADDKKADHNSYDIWQAYNAGRMVLAYRTDTNLIYQVARIGQTNCVFTVLNSFYEPKGADIMDIDLQGDVTYVSVPFGGTAPLQPLTFTGASTGEYDGTEALEINIPENGGGVAKRWDFIAEIDSGDQILSNIAVTADSSGQPFQLTDAYVVLYVNGVEDDGAKSFRVNFSQGLSGPWSAAPVQLSSPGKGQANKKTYTLNVSAAKDGTLILNNSTVPYNQGSLYETQIYGDDFGYSLSASKHKMPGGFIDEVQLYSIWKVFGPHCKIIVYGKRA